MGVTIATTRVAANTSTGTQTISTTDLGGLTPKAVLLTATRCVTDGTAADGAGWYEGASDGTNEWTEGYESQHAQATMDCEYTQDATANRILTIYDGTADAVVEATANFDSFTTNGVVIDWTDAPSSAFLITAVFFAGSDLSVHVGEISLGNTADATIAVTSVGFESDVVLTRLLRGASSLTPANVGMGVAHNDRAGTVTQRCIGHCQAGSSGSGVVLHHRSADAITRVFGSLDGEDWSGALTSFDSSGFDVQLSGGRPPGNIKIGWIALRFGSSPVVSSKVYTFSTPTSTGSSTDTGAGFKPQFVMYLANRAAAVDTQENDADAGTIGLVVVDADDVYTQSIGDEDAAADSNTQSLSDDQLNLPTHTGASGHAASFTEFTSSGVTWNWSATDGTARLWGALAIQEFTAADINLDYGSDNLAQWKQGVKISY